MDESQKLERTKNEAPIKEKKKTYKKYKTCKKIEGGKKRKKERNVFILYQFQPTTFSRPQSHHLLPPLKHEFFVIANCFIEIRKHTGVSI